MSNRVLTTMQGRVGSDVGDTSSALAVLIKTWINDRYKELLRRINYLNYARLDYQFTTTGGTEDYVLPDDFGNELYVLDKTNLKELGRIDPQVWITNNQTSSDTAGIPKNYAIYDSAVRSQPTSASVATIVSGSALDIVPTVYIRGIVSGREDYESILLTGTSPAVGTKSWDRILSVSKSDVTIGAITVSTNSAAVTIAILGRELLEHRVKLIRVIPPPASAYVMELGYTQRFFPLNNAYDYPIIDCSDALEAGALADAWRYKRQFSKAADLDVIFEKKTSDIIWEQENKPNMVHMFTPKPYSRNTV